MVAYLSGDVATAIIRIIRFQQTIDRQNEHIEVLRRRDIGGSPRQGDGRTKNSVNNVCTVCCVLSIGAV